jgi:hypothetical protein
MNFDELNIDDGTEDQENQVFESTREETSGGINENEDTN